MSRSILLPLLGLGAIILFGTTRASRPPIEVAPPMTERVEIPASAPVQRRPVAPAPPPAPALRSEAQAEEPPAVVPAPDSTAAPDSLDTPDALDRSADDRAPAP